MFFTIRSHEKTIVLVAKITLQDGHLDFFLLLLPKDLVINYTKKDFHFGVRNSKGYLYA